MPDTEMTTGAVETPAAEAIPAVERPAAASREPTFAWMERMVEKATGEAETPAEAGNPLGAGTADGAVAALEAAGLTATADSSTTGTDGGTAPAPTPGEFDDIIEHLRKQGFRNAQEVRAHAEAELQRNTERQQVEGEGRKLWSEKYQARVDSGDLTYEDASRFWQLEMQTYQTNLVNQRYERTMAEAEDRKELSDIYSDPKFVAFKETGEEGADLARVFAEVSQVPLRDSAAYFNKILSAAEERGAAREKAKQNAALEKLKTNNATVVPVMGASANAPTTGETASRGDWLSRLVARAEA